MMTGISHQRWRIFRSRVNYGFDDRYVAQLDLVYSGSNTDAGRQTVTHCTPLPVSVGLPVMRSSSAAARRWITLKCLHRQG